MRKEGDWERGRDRGRGWEERREGGEQCDKRGGLGKREGQGRKRVGREGELGKRGGWSFNCLGWKFMVCFLGVPNWSGCHGTRHIPRSKGHIQVPRGN